MSVIMFNPTIPKWENEKRWQQNERLPVLMLFVNMHPVYNNEDAPPTRSSWSKNEKTNDPKEEENDVLEIKEIKGYKRPEM